MNSLTAQLRSDHGKLISLVVVVSCLFRDNFVTFRDRFKVEICHDEELHKWMFFFIFLSC